MTKQTNAPKYSVKDVRKAGFTLEPLVCKHCKTDEVVFNQYSNSAICQNCGQDQDKRTKHCFEYSSIKSSLLLKATYLCICGKLSKGATND
jgi:ribosomal protein S27E